MSAAATAAGYLYASGRLRGRGAREQEQGQEQQPQPPEKKPARKEIRVAVLPERDEHPRPAAPAPKKTPRIEYRTRRRWTAE
jgi:hypothetical protein